MAYPSLKKMGKARTGGEGNYASSKSQPREDITKLELGLTLLPGSQTLQGGSAISKHVSPNGKRPQSKSGSDQEQGDRSPVGHRNDFQTSRFISSSDIRDSQRGSQTVVSSTVARQNKKENEFGSRELLSGNISFIAGTSEAEINTISHQELSSPVILNRYENDDIDGNEDQDYEGEKSRQKRHYLRCLRKRPKVDYRGYTDHKSRNYVNKASELREISTHSGISNDLSIPDKYEDVSLTVLHISSVNCPKSCHDGLEKFRAYISSAARENKRNDVERLGQNRVVKATWQSSRDWEEKCSKARGWSTVSGSEGLEAEINDGSDYLKPESVPKSHGCEMCMDDSFIGCSSPEPGSPQSDNFTYSVEGLSSRTEVSPRFLRRESAPSVLLRICVRSSGDGTKPASDSSKSDSGRLPGQKQNRRDPRTLVPDISCDDTCNDGKLLFLSTLSFLSSLESRTNHLYPHPLAFDVNQSSSSSSSLSSLSYVLSIPDFPRKRSITLPNLHLVKSSAVMDYLLMPHSCLPASQARPLNLPFQSHPEMSSTTPLSTRRPLGQSGLVVPAPAMHGVEASLGLYNNIGTHWQMKLPSAASSHYGPPADIAHIQMVDEVKRLQAQVQKLGNDNWRLIENLRTCYLQNNEMRMRLEQRKSEDYGDWQSVSRQLEAQKRETQIWRHRAERLEAVSRQSVPKRSPAATIFEANGHLSPEANLRSQPTLPLTGSISARATEIDTDIQFTASASSFSVSPEPVAQAMAAPTPARTVIESIGTSAETSIDLTTDGTPDIPSISPVNSAASSSDSVSTVQGLGPVELIHRRVKNGAKWMGDAHPSKRVKRPATYEPTMEQVTKRTRPDSAVSDHKLSTGAGESAEAAKKTAEKKRAQRKVSRVKTNAKAMHKKLEQVKELERKAKLREDHMKRQDQVAVEKAQREAISPVEKERAWTIEEQQSSLPRQEEASKTLSNDEDALAYLFEDAYADEDIIRIDEAQVDGEEKEEDDGLEADLEAAMAEEEEKWRKSDVGDIRMG